MKMEMRTRKLLQLTSLELMRAWNTVGAGRAVRSSKTLHWANVKERVKDNSKAFSPSNLKNGTVINYNEAKRRIDMESKNLVLES